MDGIIEVLIQNLLAENKALKEENRQLLIENTTFKVQNDQLNELFDLLKEGLKDKISSDDGFGGKA